MSSTSNIIHGERYLRMQRDGNTYIAVTGRTPKSAGAAMTLTDGTSIYAGSAVHIICREADAAIYDLHPIDDPAAHERLYVCGAWNAMRESAKRTAKHQAEAVAWRCLEASGAIGAFRRGPQRPYDLLTGLREMERLTSAALEFAASKLLASDDIRARVTRLHQNVCAVRARCGDDVQLNALECLDEIDRAEAATVLTALLDAAGKLAQYSSFEVTGDERTMLANIERLMHAAISAVTDTVTSRERRMTSPMR